MEIAFWNSIKDSDQSQPYQYYLDQFPNGAFVSLARLKLEEAEKKEQQRPAQRSYWEHNGSVMYLSAKGDTRQFFYSRPRAGMSEVGVRPDDLLFVGKSIQGEYVGTAYVFSRRCGPFPYDVRGPILDSNRRVLMHGLAPKVDLNCHIRGRSDDTLEFRLLDTAPPPEPRDTVDDVFMQRIEIFVTNDYLGGDISSIIHLRSIYADEVDYWNKGQVPIGTVIAAKRAFARKWPSRRYMLRPGSIAIEPIINRQGSYRVRFEFDYRAANGAKVVEGVGKSELVVD